MFSKCFRFGFVDVSPFSMDLPCVLPHLGGLVYSATLWTAWTFGMQRLQRQLMRPHSLKKVPWKLMVGRCILLKSSFFRWHSFIFGGVYVSERLIILSISKWELKKCQHMIAVQHQGFAFFAVKNASKMSWNDMKCAHLRCLPRGFDQAIDPHHDRLR